MGSIDRYRMRSRFSMITKLAEKRSVELEYKANESSCYYDENIPTNKVQVAKSLVKCALCTF
jgi:hypothetical protein